MTRALPDAGINLFTAAKGKKGSKFGDFLVHHKIDKGLRITSGRLPNILVNEPTNCTSQRHLRLLAVPPYQSCGGTVIYFLFHITLYT